MEYKVASLNLIYCQMTVTLRKADEAKHMSYIEISLLVTHIKTYYLSNLIFSWCLFRDLYHRHFF